MLSLLWLKLAVVLLAAAPWQGLWAHADAPPAPHDIWRSWNLELWLLCLFAFATGLYATGLRRLWPRLGARRGQGSRLSCYCLAMAFLFVALISPLDALGEALSAAHMLQHMLLFFAAPLLVLASPLPVYLWALPLNWRLALARGANRPWFSWMWRVISAAPVAWALHALALWGWHTPALYQLALEVSWIHDLEHFSFFATGLLLWWAIFRSSARTTGMLLLFTTMLHSGFLAALMTFSTRAWYPAYEDTTLAWGLTPLQDQQLAGMLMWVPGGLGYLLAGLAALALWLGRLENRSLRMEAATRRPLSAYPQRDNQG